jgi:hypothetical protein
LLKNGFHQPAASTTATADTDNSGEAAIQNDAAAAEAEGSVVSSSSSTQAGFEFVDAWHHFHNISVETESPAGFTFPACDPVKRIDFIFFANNHYGNSDDICAHASSSTNSSSKANAARRVKRINGISVPRVEIVGKLPSPDTGMHNRLCDILRDIVKMICLMLASCSTFGEVTRWAGHGGYRFSDVGKRPLRSGGRFLDIIDVITVILFEYV